jgi:hypothetical protein
MPDKNGTQIKVGQVVKFDNGEMGLVIRKQERSFDVRVFKQYANFCVLLDGQKPYYEVLEEVKPSLELADALNERAGWAS